MWQVVLGAAIAAGSTGLVAKRFFNPFSPHPSLLPEDRSEEEQEHVTTPVGIGFLGSPCEKTNGVFRFSSSGSAGSGSGSSPGFRKSPGVSCKVKVRGLMKQKKNKNNGGGSEIEKRSGNVSLKKPRTLGADSASKRDHSTFSSALGVCMMYMMSAEKNEISKLHTATEETVKAIQELKDELSRIKSLQGFKSSGKSDLTTKPEIASGEESVDTKSGKDGEYASSVLTEEPEHEAVEMEQLEMELESELQKLNLAEMWQVVLGAAIAAGSTGLVAKRFFNPFSPHPRLLPEDHSEEEQEHVTTPVGIGFLGSPCEKTNGVFRFSSSGSAGSGSGSSPGFRKSPGVTCKVKVRGLMKQKKNKRKNNGGGSEIEKRSGTVCLKKARTLSADSASKRGSGTCSNNNQDHSTFSSALGVCMMYMMSAEKNEISKLHTATEETKAELVTKEKNRASAVAMNAEIRRTKARLSEEVPKLQRLAVKRVKGLTTEELAARNDLVLALPARIEAIPDGTAGGPKATSAWAPSTASRPDIKFDSDGRFDDDYFQESHESSQFRQEFEMRKIKQASDEQGLDMISEGLDALKNMASDMNEELDRQVPLMDEIDSKVDRATSDLKNTNVRLKDTVNQVIFEP
ncbi:hypothetical protein F2Q70_00037561 [Brassica cretica]|uniref:t-SNARE coiled-coil homology domain-containing protein n=1 Tax=Brassica cretica TaxID=69181 RepID=A0A8S9JWG4_BRACR|nr:hypothetical protein F2Q70_00037561 [Brassica cretica]